MKEIFLTSWLVAMAAWPVAAHDEFDFFQEQASVITASRRAQAINESPVAVDVITAEEIAAAKVIYIWDLLRYRVGMDVVDIRSATNNRAAVSVRGFPSEFVTSLQVLVDGRSVYGGPSSGVYWEQIPVQIQDIERIEIVRGPNAALYGSNSGFGVINIITKKPANNGAFLGGFAGNQGILNTQVAAQAAGKGAGLRLSHTYNSFDGFVDAQGDKTNDVVNSHKSNLRSFWNPGRNGTLEFFAGMTHDDLGQGLNNDREIDSNNHFEMLKYHHRLGGDSSLEIIGSYRDELFEADSRQFQYDGEALHRFGWGGGRLNTAWGGSYRYIQANAPASYSRQTPRQKVMVRRGFLQQSWRPWDKLILAGAFSLKRSDLAGTEPAYQMAVVNPMSPHHTWRASYALSPTLPAPFEERVNAAFPPIVFTGNKDVDAAQVDSYEVSHLGVFRDRKIDTEATLFYMRYRNLSRPVVTSQTFFPVTIINMSFRNVDDAIARGAEAKARYRFQHDRYVYANYTYEHVTDEANLPEITDNTPHHKANLGAFVRLWGGLSASADAGYKTAYRISSVYAGGFWIPAYTRVDARLMYKLGRYEFFLAGQNLTRPWHQEFTPDLYVPRIYYAGASALF